MVTDGASDGEISSSIQQKMADLYLIVGICLGVPPETFTWEYYTKTKEFSSVGPVTPRDFYIKYVKPIFNVDDKVSVAEQYLDVGNERQMVGSRH
jgi:bleomycin hydrolase